MEAGTQGVLTYLPPGGLSTKPFATLVGRPVLPVDTHVYRLGKRLGLLENTISAEVAHDVLGQLVPDRLVLDFHVKLLDHGRAVCKAQKPRCTGCVLLDLCPEGQRGVPA